MNNFLVAIAVFVIAVLTAAFAIPRVVHWDNYRGVIEEEATRLLGRDVRVGGGVRVRLLPSPSFSVDKITIADTEASTGEPFFKVEALSGQLAIAPLLRGTFQATEMRLLRPVVHVVLDGTGGGNWKSLGQGNGRLPFQMSDVALDQVSIVGGVFVVHGPDRAERLRLEAIDGVLSAVALEGPFRFRGTFGSENEKRDLRVSTSRQEADGSIRFKAALQQLDTGATYNFDARAVDLAKSPRVEGELSAKVSMPNLAGPQAGNAKDAKTEPDAPLELRAALTADLKLVKLANLNLSFERQGRPQILTGEATIDLSKSVALDARLAAKWLDLDQVIGVAPTDPATQAATGATQGPIQGLLTLAQRLNGFSPDQGQAQLVLDVEQANLGREAVNGLRMALVGKGAETDIREFRVGLPGGSQADIKGLMTGSGVETSFDGDVVLRGGSLARFLTWASGGSVTLDAARDGAFAMRSKLVTSPGAVAAREFTGELAGTIMQGELGYRWQNRPEVSVLIEGPRVDLRAVLGTGAGSVAPSGANARATPSLIDLLTAGSTFGANAQADKTDAILRVRAGELVLPGATFADAAIDLELRAGQLRINRLSLVSDAGVAIDAEGEVPTAASKARGTMRGTIAAANAVAVKSLASFLSVPADLWPNDVLSGELAPLRLAGSVAFASGEGQPVDILFDGDTRDTRLAGKMRFNQGLAAWRTTPLDAVTTLTGARAVELFRRLSAGSGPSDTPVAVGDGAGPGGGVKTMTIHVTGTPNAGLVTHASLADPQPRMSFSGRTVLVAGQPLKVDGQVRFDGADARTALTLLAPAARTANVADGADALPLTGRARIESSADEIRLEAIDASVGGVGMRGTLALDAGRTSLTGRLALTALPVIALLGPLSDGAPGASDASQPWPATKLSGSAFGALSGQIQIAAQRLNLPGSVGLNQASFQLVFAPGRVEIRDLDGRGAGGTWSGGAKLESARDGTAATVLLRLKDVQVAQVVPAAPSTGAAPITTSVSGMVTLTGRGATPRDIVAAATGRGSVVIGDARLAVLGPAGLSTILQSALRGPTDQLAQSIRQGILAHRVSEPTLLLPARSLEIDVKNGVASLSPVGVEQADGQVVGAVAVDLKTMGYSAQWRVETKADPLPPPPGWTTTVTASGAIVPRKPFVPLPPVMLTSTGSFLGPQTAKVDISTDALEREVAVRKLERDLEDLERLRKLDEERAKEEAERRRAAENPAQPASSSQAGAVPGSVAGAPPAPSIVPGAIPGTLPGQPALLPLPGADPSTDAAAVPDTVDPSLRPRPALPATAPTPAPTPAPAPAPKPAIRPMNSEEHRKIFGGG